MRAVDEMQLEPLGGEEQLALRRMAKRLRHGAFLRRQRLSCRLSLHVARRGLRRLHRLAARQNDGGKAFQRLGGEEVRAFRERCGQRLRRGRAMRRDIHHRLFIGGDRARRRGRVLAGIFVDNHAEMLVGSSFRGQKPPVCQYLATGRARAARHEAVNPGHELVNLPRAVTVSVYWRRAARLICCRHVNAT